MMVTTVRRRFVRERLGDLGREHAHGAAEHTGKGSCGAARPHARHDLEGHSGGSDGPRLRDHRGRLERVARDEVRDPLALTRKRDERLCGHVDELEDDVRLGEALGAALGAKGRDRPGRRPRTRRPAGAHAASFALTAPERTWKRPRRRSSPSAWRPW